MEIFIADDDPVSLGFLESMLLKWGYSVISAPDGATAWDHLQKENSPNLIILDWMMPGMSGLDICEEVRSQASLNPPYIILLTSRNNTSDVIAGLNKGANDYVTKPYDRNELLARIRVGERMIQLQNELNRIKEELAYKAHHDELTGIYNRRAIFSILQKELIRASREKSGLALCICDIDHFKQVNDQYGHQAGDEILLKFVSAISLNLRGYDSIGRIGGEEFCIVAPTRKNTGINGIFQRICSSIAKTEFSTNAGQLSITASFGVTHNLAEDSVESIVARADSALYEAKNKGRNQVVFVINEVEKNEK